MANEQVDYLTNIGRHSLAGGLDADTFDAPSTDDFDFDDTVVAVLGHGDGGDFGDEFGLDGGDGVYADEDAGNEQAADGFVDDAHPNDDMTDSNAFEFEITYEDEENKEGKEQPTLSLGSGVGISNTPTASNATLGVSLNKGADDESEIGYESEEDGVEKHGEGTTVDMSNIQSHEDVQPPAPHPEIQEHVTEPGGEELAQDEPCPESAQYDFEEELPAESNGFASHVDSTGSHPSTQEDALQAQGTELEAGIGNDTDISAGSATTLGLPDIVVIWNGERYSLFGKEDDDPDTFFLTDVAVMDLPLSDFLHRLRHVIASEMSSSDELVVRVGQLAFQFGPKSPQKFLSRTFREILECYEKLTMNDGAPSSTMILSLVSLRDCEERFAELLQHADLGKGLSEVVDFASELQVDESSTASALEEKEQYDERDQVNEAIAEADSGNAESQGQRLSTEHIYGWPEGVEPYYDEDGRLVAVKDLPAHGKEQMYHELRSEYSAEQLYGYPKGVEPIYDNEARLIAVKDLPSYGMAEEFYDYTGHSPQGYIKMEKTNDDSQDLDEEATNNNESLSDGDLETTAQDTGEDEVQTDYVFADGSLERYEAESDNTQTYTAAPGANDLEDPTYVPGDSDETDPLIQNGRLDVNCFNSDYELASRGEDAIGENDHVIASGINGTPDTSTSNGAMAVLTSSKETRQNGHSVDAADIFDNVNAGEQIQSLDPAGPQNLEGFDATVGEISWEDGDDTHPDESAMIGATELSTSFSGKRSRQTDATESLANESDHKRRRT